MVPISEASLGYAQDVRRRLRAAHLQADVDASDRKMQKKVREAQLEQYNYILVRRGGSADARHSSALLRARHACVLGCFECGFPCVDHGLGHGPQPMQSPGTLEPGHTLGCLLSLSVGATALDWGCQVSQG